MKACSSPHHLITAQKNRKFEPWRGIDEIDEFGEGLKQAPNPKRTQKTAQIDSFSWCGGWEIDLFLLVNLIIVSHFFSVIF